MLGGSNVVTGYKCVSECISSELLVQLITTVGILYHNGTVNGL